MFIQMNDGQIRDVWQADAFPLIASGAATLCHKPDDFESKYLERLQKGNKVIFLPHVGEFGIRLLTAVRFVAFHSAKEKIVACRENETVLYGSAQKHITNWIDPIPDAIRVGSGKAHDWSVITSQYPDYLPFDCGCLSPLQELIPIYPERRIPFRPRSNAAPLDVVIGTRLRQWETQRNYAHWHSIATCLANRGITYGTIGAFPLPGGLSHAGHDTDLAIAMLQKCQVYVGLDSGCSHLAAAVGAEMIVFRYEQSGRNMIPLMEIYNPARVQYLPDAWDNPAKVIDAILTRLCKQ